MRWNWDESWTGSNMGDEGAAKISESLMANNTLTKLNLRCDNNVSKVLYLEKKRKPNKKQCKWQMIWYAKKKKQWKWKDNNIGYEGAAKISESLMANTTLTTLDLECDDNIMKNNREKCISKTSKMDEKK